MDLQGPLTSISSVLYQDDSGQELHFNEQSSKILGVLAKRAAMRGDVKVFHYFLHDRGGLDINQKDISGCTALNFSSSETLPLRPERLRILSASLRIQPERFRIQPE